MNFVSWGPTLAVALIAALNAIWQHARFSQKQDSLVAEHEKDIRELIGEVKQLTKDVGAVARELGEHVAACAKKIRRAAAPRRLSHHS